MSAIKKWIHQLLVPVGGAISKLLPDKIPLTFVGADASKDLCESIAHTHAKRVLVVTDAGLVEVGIVERITDALAAAGLEFSVYSGVEPDPTFTQVQAGVEQYDRDGCDTVLAVGGGSSMDAAKVIAAMATNRVPLEKLEGPMKVRKLPAPFFAIPTTAGTGSEVTLAAVLSDPDTHAKKFFIDPKLLPLMTALDPSLMTGLPPHITAATGMDALTHAVESFLSRTSNEKTEVYARTSIRLVFDHLHSAYSEGHVIESRKAMALASYYGGLAFTRTSVGYVHAIAHTFGAFYGTPHGLANAIALPHVLEFSKDTARGRLAAMAELIGLEGGSEAERADRFIAAVRDLMAKLDISEKLDALRAEDIPSIARQALGEAHLNYPVPRYMSQSQCEALLQQIVA
jgi:alcohol dehydrogenase class IV